MKLLLKSLENPKKGYSYGEQWFLSSWKNLIVTFWVYGGVDFVLNVNWALNK